jgi:putative transposase
MGLKSFATLAAGKENTCTTIENPRFLKRQLEKLRYLSRQLSKKVKKSKNSLKAKLKLSRLHAYIKNLRNNFAQQLSAKMVKSHDIFCMESLDIARLLRGSPRGRSRSISDAGWRYFLHCLKYKAEEYGKYIIQVDKYFPSSQICGSCDQSQKMPLSVRVYDCPNCGVKNDRDYNSAIVLKAAGMSVLKACGAALVRGSA